MARSRRILSSGILACWGLVALLSAGCSSRGVITIADIQAPAHRSPLENERVEGVEGIVVAIKKARGHHGFWMTAAEPDADPSTSEGIIVVTGDQVPKVAIGDKVRISGTVAELVRRDNDLPVTSLVEPIVEILERGLPLPEPIIVGVGGLALHREVIEDDEHATFDPSKGVLDRWESLEGMRVEIRQPRVVGADDAHGNVVLVTGDVPKESSRGGLLLARGENHPERIEVATRPGGEPPSYWIGDVLEGSVTGVVDYGFGFYRIQLTEPLPAVQSPNRSRERTDLLSSRDSLTVASYNVLNLSAESSDQRFGRLAETIVLELGSPDIVALQEIQDDSGRENDGIVTAEVTLERLILAIAKTAGPRYVWRQIDPTDGEDGGQPGGNIRVAYLVNPARVEIVDRNEGDARGEVEVVAGPHLNPSPGRLGVQHACFAPDADGRNGSRKTLALEVRFNGETIFLFNNHWTSKFADDSLFGARQPAFRPSEEERICQAEIVRDFAQGILDLDAHAAVIILGDFNDYDFDPAMQTLVTGGWVNLIHEIPRADRYSYVYRGAAGAIDHVIVSPRLAADHDPEVDIVHVNANFPEQDRASDHDPLVVRFRFSD